SRWCDGSPLSAPYKKPITEEKFDRNFDGADRNENPRNHYAWRRRVESSTSVDVYRWSDAR
ncbi:hypothetical protein TNCV_4770471, partial [Trichonephila clavipes]